MLPRHKGQCNPAQHRPCTDGARHAIGRIKQTGSLVSAHWADVHPNPNLRTYTKTAPVLAPQLVRRITMDTFSNGTGIHLEPLGVATGKRRLSEPESASLGVPTHSFLAANELADHYCR